MGKERKRSSFGSGSSFLFNENDSLYRMYTSVLEDRGLKCIRKLVLRPRDRLFEPMDICTKLSEEGNEYITLEPKIKNYDELNPERCTNWELGRNFVRYAYFRSSLCQGKSFKESSTPMRGGHLVPLETSPYQFHEELSINTTPPQQKHFSTNSCSLQIHFKRSSFKLLTQDPYRMVEALCDTFVPLIRVEKSPGYDGTHQGDWLAQSIELWAFVSDSSLPSHPLVRSILASQYPNFYKYPTNVSMGSCDPFELSQTLIHKFTSFHNIQQIFGDINSFAFTIPFLLDSPMFRDPRRKTRRRVVSKYSRENKLKGEGILYIVPDSELKSVYARMICISKEYSVQAWESMVVIKNKHSSKNLVCIIGENNIHQVAQQFLLLEMWISFQVSDKLTDYFFHEASKVEQEESISDPSVSNYLWHFLQNAKQEDKLQSVQNIPTPSTAVSKTLGLETADAFQRRIEIKNSIESKTSIIPDSVMENFQKSVMWKSWALVIVRNNIFKGKNEFNDIMSNISDKLILVKSGTRILSNAHPTIPKDCYSLTKPIPCTIIPKMSPKTFESLPKISPEVLWLSPQDRSLVRNMEIRENFTGTLGFVWKYYEDDFRDYRRMRAYSTAMEAQASIHRALIKRMQEIEEFKRRVNEEHIQVSTWIQSMFRPNYFTSTAHCPQTQQELRNQWMESVREILETPEFPALSIGSNPDLEDGPTSQCLLMNRGYCAISQSPMTFSESSLQHTASFDEWANHILNRDFNPAHEQATFHAVSESLLVFNNSLESVIDELCKIQKTLSSIHKRLMQVKFRLCDRTAQRSLIISVAKQCVYEGDMVRLTTQKEQQYEEEQDIDMDSDSEEEEEDKDSSIIKYKYSCEACSQRSECMTLWGTLLCSDCVGTGMCPITRTELTSSNVVTFGPSAIAHETTMLYEILQVSPDCLKTPHISGTRRDHTLRHIRQFVKRCEQRGETCALLENTTVYHRRKDRYPILMSTPLKSDINLKHNEITLKDIYKLKEWKMKNKNKHPNEACDPYPFVPIFLIEHFGSKEFPIDNILIVDARAPTNVLERDKFTSMWMKLFTMMAHYSADTGKWTYPNIYMMLAYGHSGSASMWHAIQGSSYPRPPAPSDEEFDPDMSKVISHQIWKHPMIKLDELQMDWTRNSHICSEDQGEDCLDKHVLSRRIDFLKLCTGQEEENEQGEQEEQQQPRPHSYHNRVNSLLSMVE